MLQSAGNLMRSSDLLGSYFMPVGLLTSKEL